MTATVPDALPATGTAGHCLRLKQATTATHRHLDARIMRADPFSSRERYARFVQMQYRFHHDMDRLHARHGALLGELAPRGQLALLAADLDDLERPHPAPANAEALPLDDAVAALGWLYVAEGSRLGAAILFKLAAKLGLDAGFGARHLAAHPDGRAGHWRDFTAAMDRLALEQAEEARMIDGACRAFAQVHAHADAAFVD